MRLQLGIVLRDAETETERETGEEGSNMKVQAQQTSQEPKRVQTKSTFLWLAPSGILLAKNIFQQRNRSKFKGLSSDFSLQNAVKLKDMIFWGMVSICLGVVVDVN